MKRMATLAAMSPLVGTMTADVVAAASAVMTVPTKTWQQQWGGTFSHENMQQSIKQQNKAECATFHQTPSWEHTTINQVETQNKSTQQSTHTTLFNTVNTCNNQWSDGLVRKSNNS